MRVRTVYFLTWGLSINLELVSQRGLRYWLSVFYFSLSSSELL